LTIVLTAKCGGRFFDDFRKRFVKPRLLLTIRADARATRFRFAVEGELMRFGDCSSRSQARTNQFAPAGKSGEIMKRHAADDYHAVMFG
jgi:hypothetical protein